MEQVLDPNRRRWISPLTNLGESVEELKRHVRLRKDMILVVDPTEDIESGAEKDANAREAKRRKRQEGSELPSSSSLPGSSMNGNIEKEYEPDFMSAEARQIDYEDKAFVENQANPSSDFGMAQESKWEDNNLPNSAVASVGGPDFFGFKKQVLINKDGEVLIRNRKGRRKKARGKEDGDDDFEFDDEYYEGHDEQLGCEEHAADRAAPPPLGTSMYENFNYGDLETSQQNKEYELMNKDVYSEFHKMDSTLVPLELDEPEGEATNILFDFDYENDIDNFINAAQRYDTYRSTRQDCLNSESEESSAAENSSDEEENPPQSSLATPSASSRRGRGATTASASVLAGIKQETISNDTPGTRSTRTSDCFPGGGGRESTALVLRGPGPAIGQQTEYVPADEENEMPAAEDFKKFMDWVLVETKKQDDKKRNQFKPGLAEKLNLEENDVGYLQHITSTNLTTVKGEVFRDDAVMKSSSMPLMAAPILPPVTINLQSLAVFITHGEDPSCFPWKSINVQQQMNDDFNHNEFIKRMEQQKLDLANPAMSDELVNKEEDFLVQLLVYQATDPDDVLPEEMKMCAEPRLAYELHMLGSQTVQDLMNKIHCENDYVYMEEVRHPDSFKLNPKRFAKTAYPSSVMLIHETFYNTPKGTADYTTVVNDWIKKKPEKKLGPFKTGDANTQLKDLELRFGFPYVFIHLGGCEHIIVFTKARLLHHEDNHLTKDYPKINGPARFKNVYCRVDNEFLARWAVLDFKDFPENPMLLCTECVKMYCFDKQKKRRGDFRLFPFTQMANII